VSTHQRVYEDSETIDTAAQAVLLIQLQEEVQTLQAAAATADFAANAATAATAKAIPAKAIAAEAAVAEAATAEAANEPPGPGAPPVPVFTLAPALANTANYIDLTSANGSKYLRELLNH
jgi:hypothetical protein